MADKNDAVNNVGNAIKDPDDWTTGDEPMTGAQRSYLHTLATEAGEEIDENMTKSRSLEEDRRITTTNGQG